jgi:hypothetical protein
MAKLRVFRLEVVCREFVNHTIISEQSWQAGIPRNIKVICWGKSATKIIHVGHLHGIFCQNAALIFNVH